MTDIPIRERLARALAKRLGDHCDLAMYLDDVDAILAELQEPSEGMVEIGLAEIPLDVHERADLPRAWKWMIQHIRDGGS